MQQQWQRTLLLLLVVVLSVALLNTPLHAHAAKAAKKTKTTPVFQFW